MPSDDDRIGQQLGRYRILGRIGRGRLETVFLAEHDQLERRAAVHVFDDRGAEFRARLLENVRAAADVADPHLVTIYDAGDADDGAVYLATRYIPGQDLRAILLQDGALEIDRAVAIVEPVAEALGAVHGRGLVHGGVRADCILVESSADGHERSHLSDLWSTGLYEADDRASADSGLGIPAGVAAELLDGAPPSARSDVHALGTVLAQCLTGVAPAPERPPDGLPEGLDRVVARALAADPGDRQRDGAELAAEIRAAVASRPSRRPTQPVTVPASRRPPRWTVAAGVLAAAVAVAATIVLLHGSGGSAPVAPAASGPTGVLVYDRMANTSDVATVSARGGVPAVLTHGKADYDPAWSPSGHEIAFLRAARMNDTSARVMEMSPNGSHLHTLLARPLTFPGGFGADGRFTNGLAWSPDGRRLALAALDGGQVAALQVIDANVGGVRTIVHDCEGTANPHRATVIRCRRSLLHSQCRLHAFGQNTPQCITYLALFSPAWGPDGRTIAFSAGIGPGPILIYLVRSDGTGLHALMPPRSGKVFQYDPAWSPSGRRIAFDVCRNGDNDECSLDLVAPDGSHLQHLSTGQTDAWDPTWSPDGRYLAYECEQQNVDNLCVMRADGRDQRIVLRGTNAAQPNGLAWTG